MLITYRIAHYGTIEGIDRWAIYRSFGNDSFAHVGNLSTHALNIWLEPFVRMKGQFARTKNTYLIIWNLPKHYYAGREL